MNDRNLFPGELKTNLEIVINLYSCQSSIKKNRDLGVFFRRLGAKYVKNSVRADVKSKFVISLVSTPLDTPFCNIVLHQKIVCEAKAVLDMRLLNSILTKTHSSVDIRDFSPNAFRIIS